MGDVKYEDVCKTDPDNAAGSKYATLDDGYFIDREIRWSWVKYDPKTKTLTFMHNTDKFESPYNDYEYPLNKGDNEVAWQSINPEVQKVYFDKSFEDARPESCHGWFRNADNLTDVFYLVRMNTEKVKDMSYMFAYCKNLSSLDVSGLKTQNVKDMSSMFEGCSKLEALETDNFNTQNVTNMEAMFKDCERLHIIDFRKFDTKNVTNMNLMFDGCKALTSLDLSSFDTRNVEDMSCMFENCRSLASLDLRNFDTGNVWNMYSMFAECCGLKSLDLSHFDTRNVINMQNMFSATYSYDQPCLTTLDLSNFNTEKVVETEKMFAGNNKLQTIYVGDKFVLSAITEDLKGQDYRMFDGCTALKGAVAYNAAKTDMEMANYTTGYLTKLVAKGGDEKIGAVGETLKADCTMNLSDDKDLTLYGVEGFKVSAANYTRDKVTGGQWASLCLPFKISMNEAQPFHAYTLLSATNDVITLKEEMADIEAGTPLLIHMNEGATELSFNGKDVDIKAVKEGSTTENAAYQLVGLYATKMFDKGTDNNCYIVKGDKLMNPAKMLEASEAVQKVGSRPYRAYVQAKIQPTAQANMLSIAISDEATGIKAIDALNGDAPAEYYDMQGRRINGLQKGINIVKRGNKTTKVIVR